MSLPEENPAGSGRLARLQEELFHAVVRGGDCPAVTKADGLAAYQLAYHLRLREALREDFPASFRLLPDAARERWLEEFFGSAPSSLYTLNAFGALWLDFLRARAAELPPGLLELAAFEWELVLALYRDSGPEAERGPVSLPTDPPLRLRLGRGLVLVQAAWPVDAIYEQERLLPPAACHLAIWRRKGQATYLRVEPAVFVFLERLLAGQGWEAAVAELPQTAEAAALLEEMLSLLTAEALLQLDA